MQEVECVVIGAGVVGLAIARELAQHGHEVLVLEAEDAIGTGTSSRSSEVVHAGIYYPRDSLKATLCVQGREALYRYCAQRSVPHHRCGKLIVAVDEAQRTALARLHVQAIVNGVQGLRVLDRHQVLAREPELHCVTALYSPDTGIIDSHALMLALSADAEAAGAIIALRAPVVQASRVNNGFVLQVAGEGACRLHARMLVNAAGHGAVALAAGLRTPDPPRAYFAKGHYFALRGRTPFRHLVYPLPEPGGLGIHLTLDLAGRARFGPDVEWVPSADYECDPSRVAAFDASIRRYWPGLPEDSLAPAYCGVRPKISGPGEPPADFRIDGPDVHGIPGLVQLFGIESPGLTACMAIGALVREALTGAKRAAGPECF